MTTQAEVLSLMDYAPPAKPTTPDDWTPTETRETFERALAAVNPEKGILTILLPEGKFTLDANTAYGPSATNGAALNLTSAHSGVCFLALGNTVLRPVSNKVLLFLNSGADNVTFRGLTVDNSLTEENPQNGLLNYLKGASTIDREKLGIGDVCYPLSALPSYIGSSMNCFFYQLSGSGVTIEDCVFYDLNTVCDYFGYPGCEKKTLGKVRMVGNTFVRCCFGLSAQQPQYIEFDNNTDIDSQICVHAFDNGTVTGFQYDPNHSIYITNRPGARPDYVSCQNNKAINHQSDPMKLRKGKVIVYGGHQFTNTLHGHLLAGFEEAAIYPSAVKIGHASDFAITILAVENNGSGKAQFTVDKPLWFSMGHSVVDGDNGSTPITLVNTGSDATYSYPNISYVTDGAGNINPYKFVITSLAYTAPTITVDSKVYVSISSDNAIRIDDGGVMNGDFGTIDLRGANCFGARIENGHDTQPSLPNYGGSIRMSFIHDAVPDTTVIGSEFVRMIGQTGRNITVECLRTSPTAFASSVWPVKLFGCTDCHVEVVPKFSGSLPSDLNKVAWLDTNCVNNTIAFNYIQLRERIKASGLPLLPDISDAGTGTVVDAGVSAWPRFCVTLAAASIVDVTGASNYRIAFDTIEYDTGLGTGGFNTGNNRYIAREAGYYKFGGSVRVNNADGTAIKATRILTHLITTNDTYTEENEILPASTAAGAVSDVSKALRSADGAFGIASTPPVWLNKGDFAEFDLQVVGTSQVVTFDSSTDTATVTAHGYGNGTAIRFATTGALPGGLAINTIYYARDVTANTFKIAATSGGTAIDLNGTASGTNTVTGNSVQVLGVSGTAQRTWFWGEKVAA